jgi:aconitate hydratase
MADCIDQEQFLVQYADVFHGSQEWASIETARSDLFDWPPESTYIQEPPFFMEMSAQPQPIRPVSGARCLAFLGDSVTTDHISPAGAIAAESPAGQHLQERGVPVSMFNTFGARRGNDRVMVRGTFGNVRIRNKLAPGTEGGWTKYLGPAGDGEAGSVMSIYDASIKYREAGTPLVVVAGKDYGMGSSRDWAAKGTLLLGVRAVIAESFERIHRSNLVGMGVLPLTFPQGADAGSLGLDGTEVYDIDIPPDLEPRQEIRVTARKADGETIEIKAQARVDTPVEVEYYRNGGILHAVLRRMAAS